MAIQIINLKVEVCEAFLHTLKLLLLKCLSSLFKTIAQLTTFTINSIIIPFSTPAISLISGYEFAHQGQINLQTKNQDILTCLIFFSASILTTSVGIVLLGRRFRNRAAHFKRRAITLSGNVNAVSTSGRILDFVATLFETIGCFTYIHADLGLLDVLVFAWKVISPKAIASIHLFASSLKVLIVGIYNFCKLFVLSSTAAIWYAANNLAWGVKQILKRVFKSILFVAKKIWKSPFLGLFFSGVVLYVSYFVHVNYPEFTLKDEVLKVVEVANEVGTGLISKGTYLSTVISTNLKNLTTTIISLTHKQNLDWSYLTPILTKAQTLKTNGWKWFGSKTFAKANFLFHLITSRVLRTTWAFHSNSSETRVGAVAAFGRQACQLLLYPVVVLSIFGYFGGDLILWLVEKVSTPFVYLFFFIYICYFIRMAGDWSRTEKELHLNRVNRREPASSPSVVVGNKVDTVSGSEMEGILKYKEDNGGTHIIENKDCVSCMESCSGKEEFRVLVCGHRPLCEECLRHWIGTKKRMAACPCCRQNLYTAM